MLQQTHIIIDRDVPVTMRDGIILYADVYRQDDDTPHPVILMRLPYNKDQIQVGYVPEPKRAVEAGFALVVQDTRGRFKSEGDFSPFQDDAQDGYDTVEWAATQSWSTGRIGMAGASYVGATQWFAATQQPPHLKAIFPIITVHDYHEGWIYQGGALEHGFSLIWALGFAQNTLTRLVVRGEAPPQELQELLEVFDHLPALLDHLPVGDIEVLQRSAPYYRDWIRHESNDDYWQQLAPATYHAGIEIPVYNVAGWYDLFLGGSLANYIGMRQQAGSERARSSQRLLIGPWVHALLTSTFAERDFGALADLNTLDLAGIQLRWFARWLCDDQNGIDQEPSVKFFTMGINQWRLASDWPLPETQFTPYYLHSGGQANTRSGNGSLSLAPPDAEPADHYIYDPHNPVPTLGGQFVTTNAGPRDQRSIEERDDVLVYTTPTLQQDVDVTGPPVVRLFAATSGTDTDFTAKLVDVFPGGRAFNLREGIIRAKFRHGTREALLVVPCDVVEYIIDVWATSNVFQVGHQIRLEISSSSFPRFDRNPNTGHPLGADGPQDLRVASQTIYHNATYPSHVLLPIIPQYASRSA